jgi:hypothetical protein
MLNILKSLGVGLLCISVGYLFAHYLSKEPLPKLEHAFMKKAAPLIQEAEKLADEAKGPLEKDVKKGEKEVETLAKEAGNEIDPHKKSEAKQEDLSLKLLGSLWPVKKRSIEPKSMTTGPVYMDGTSNYGPSQIAEENLLAPENLLHLERDPSQRSLKPIRNSTAPPFKISLSLEETHPSKLFWVQLGAFESPKAAQEAALYFRRRGYDAGTFKPTDPLDPSPLYFVRLQLPVTEEEGLRRTHLFKVREKISATLVPCGLSPFQNPR